MALMKYVLEQDVTCLPSVTEEPFGDFKEIAQEAMESSNMWNKMDLWSTHLVGVSYLKTFVDDILIE